MSYCSRKSTATDKQNTIIGSRHLPTKSPEYRAQTSRTLNSHLYATPNVIECLTQGAARSEAEYRARAAAAIDAFDKAFYGGDY